jgi:dTDP-D-glucose 4,6-dehydratase
VNIEKARRMLRWAPQVTLQSGLEQTASWMRSASFEPIAEQSATPANAPSR